jgi:predicted O-methyltransferase YrrM
MHSLQARIYARKGRHAVRGWLSRQDAEIILALLACQIQAGFSGGCAEIGVHHGRAFILLALGNPDGKNYAIDLFDRQELNVDRSGSGNLTRFNANLQAFGVDASKVVIDARSSFDATPDDIMAAIGLVRLFHVDGGHHKAAVLNDLALAEATIAEHGIVVVDDVFRPEWPEVSSGLFIHLAQSSRLVPFAVGFNKTFLCRPDHADRYRKALRDNDFLRMYLTRIYHVNADKILVFQRYPLPEWPTSLWLQHFLQSKHPDLAYWLFRRRNQKSRR